MTAAGDVSPLTLNRLSVYLRSLRQLREQGVKRISSQRLADRFHLSSAQIRKDLAQFGEFGIRGVGYEIEHLIERLTALLGLDRRLRLLIVGVGNLGSALTRYVGFNTGSFQVVGAVDTDPDKVGGRVGNVTVHHPAELTRLVGETGAEIGILAVPAEAAQETYEALVAAGIRAVLNFAPVRLRIAAGVPTKSVDFRIHLEELGFYLARGRGPRD